MRRQAYAAISLTLLLILPASLPSDLGTDHTGSSAHGKHRGSNASSHAQALAIDPDLFHAIVQTESAGHAWALGWSDQTGRRHSYVARRQEDAAPCSYVFSRPLPM